MPDDDHSILSYASPDIDGRHGHSGFGVAAVVLLSVNFVGFFLPGPFNDHKHFQVFCAAWLLGLFLTIAAYNQRHRSLAQAHAGAVLVVVDFLLTTLLPSI